jgi:hypothetical protein
MTRPSCKAIWISCGCIFGWFLFFLQWAHLAGLSSNTLWNLPSSSKNHIIYIVIYLDFLHSDVKSYNFIFFNIYIVYQTSWNYTNIYFFTLTCFVFYINTNVNEYYTIILARSVNKFHYGIYTYTECKS